MTYFFSICEPFGLDKLMWQLVCLSTQFSMFSPILDFDKNEQETSSEDPLPSLLLVYIYSWQVKPLRVASKIPVRIKNSHCHFLFNFQWIFLVHLSRRLKCTIVITYCSSSVRPSVRPSLTFHIFDFSETTEQNSMKLDRKQEHNILYQICVFQADQ